jgi:cell division protein FtsQ
MAGFALPVRLPQRPRWLRAPRRPRRALLLASALLALALGVWLWFRDSSLVSVQAVRITGVSGQGAAGIDAALARAAHGMSTLDVDEGALRAAVASYPQVRAIQVSTSFPHSMHIAVLEQPAVAVLQAPDGARSAVAADGVLLGRSFVTSELALITVASIPRKRAHDPTVSQDLAVLGAAPPALARFVARVYDGPKGLTVGMRGGMLVYFGDASRAHAKWLAFASVLVASRTANAAYVDVRLPERTAISSGPAGSGEVSAASSSGQGPLATGAALEAALQAAINGGGTSSGTALSPSASGVQSPTGEVGAQGASGESGTHGSPGESGSSEAEGG